MNWCERIWYDDKVCGNWVCKCGHLSHIHFGFDGSCMCGCKSFKYKNNDQCSLECLIRYKLEGYT